MKQFALAVVDFNQRVLQIPEREKGLLPPHELDITMKALQEEAEEFLTSHTIHDYIGCVDALVDLMYFATGALYKMGLTPDQIHDCCMAVHDCNITKKLGVVERRGDGTAADAVKPENWVGPEERIAEILGGA